MRFYRLFIDNKLVSELTADKTDGIAIAFNLQQSLLRNNPNSIINIYNASQRMFSQQNNLNDQLIRLEAGMDGFLPTITKSQRGIIFNGRIQSHYSQYNGKDTELSLICTPASNSFESALVLKITKNDIIYQKIQNVLSKLNIQAVFSPGVQKLRAKNNQIVKMLGLSSIYNYLANYDVLSYMTQNGLLFILRDEATNRPPTKIKDIDMLGQPEATDGGVVFFLQLRADLNMGDRITFDSPGYINFSTSDMVSQGTYLTQNTTSDLYSMYSGEFVILEIHHSGQSYNSDGFAWSTMVKVSRTSTLKKV